MNAKIRKLLATIVGVLCGLAATLALAGEWSEKTSIARIVVRDDQSIVVYRKGGNWKNPDLCDKDNTIVLRPPGASGATPAYKELYATILGAHLASRKIKAFLNGCTTVANQSYPTLVRVMIY